MTIDLVVPAEPGDSRFRVSSSGTPQEGTDRKNWVLIAGWNMTDGGQRIDESLPGFGLSMESYYSNGDGAAPWPGAGMIEFHLLYVDLNGVQNRPISWICRIDGTGSRLMLEASAYDLYGPDPTHAGEPFASLGDGALNLFSAPFRHHENNRGALYSLSAESTAVELIRVDPWGAICVGADPAGQPTFVTGRFGSGITPGYPHPAGAIHGKSMDATTPCFVAELAEEQTADIFGCIGSPFRVDAAGAVYPVLPTTQPPDAVLAPGQMVPWFDEANDSLIFRVRRSDGTYTNKYAGGGNNQ